ncbi:MAG: TRAP transporter substrate-binding protein [Hungatella hathewayi]|nr:TRAP transporter substrate-binding protein [Hungatella hathewayi]
MKKRFVSTVLCAAMVAGSLAGCGLKTPETTTAAPAPETTTAAAAEETKAAAEETAAAAEASDTPEVTLVYAEVNPLDTIVGQMATAFKEKVEELSGGKIAIDIQASGVLGSENDVLDTMLGGGGTIDMSRISAFALTSYGVEKSVLLSIPYTFVNRDHFWNFANSDLAPEFLMEPHDNDLGVRGLFYGEEGFRHFFTVKEISGLEDLKGMKLRVSNDPTALQTGVVDGAEQPIANYKSNAFQEVAPNLILDGHTLGAVQVIITDEAWDKLTEEQQNILMEAGKYASDFNRKISEEAENKVLDELKAEGIHVIEVPDITPWQEACKDIIDSSTADNKELYQKILDMK